MSQVAALLLMYLEREEDAFWGLHKLMVGNLYRMHGLFIPNFPKLIRYKTGLSLIFISTVACGHFNLRIYGAFQLSLEGPVHCRFQIKIKLICRLTNDKDQALISISSWYKSYQLKLIVARVKFQKWDCSILHFSPKKCF